MQDQILAIEKKNEDIVKAKDQNLLDKEALLSEFQEKNSTLNKKITKAKTSIKETESKIEDALEALKLKFVNRSDIDGVADQAGSKIGQLKRFIELLPVAVDEENKQKDPVEEEKVPQRAQEEVKQPQPAPKEKNKMLFALRLSNSFRTCLFVRDIQTGQTLKITDNSVDFFKVCCIQVAEAIYGFKHEVYPAKWTQFTYSTTPNNRITQI